MSAVRSIFYVLLSLALAGPAYCEAYLRPAGNATLWYALGLALLMIWSSWPPYPGRWLRALTYGLTALVAGNFVIGAYIVLFDGEYAPTLDPNLNVVLRYTDAARPPGVFGDQHVTTDARGYRVSGPIDYRAKPPGTLRLVTIGASTTEESKLDDRKTWSFLLGERLAAAAGRKVEVINTALSGLRAEHNYRALLEIESLQPDVVTFLMGINDWNTAAMRPRLPLAQRIATRLRAFSLLNSPLYKELKELKERMSGPHGPPAAPEIRIDDGSYTAAYVDALERPSKASFHAGTVDPGYAGWVGKIFEECRRRQLFCLFADQPTAYTPDLPDDLRRRLWMTPPFSDYTFALDDVIALSRLYNAWIAREATGNAAFCPLAANIPATTEYLIDDCHFNEKGARRVAELMAACVIAERPQLAGK